LSRIEPCRRQRDVNGPGQLATWCGSQGHSGSAGDHTQSGERDDVPTRQIGSARSAVLCAAARTHRTSSLSWSELCGKARPPFLKCLHVSKEVLRKAGRPPGSYAPLIVMSSYGAV